VYQLQKTYGSAGAAFWNLGHEIDPQTFDVNPSTPLTWQQVVLNKPGP
jgi:hypothetical protein